MKAWISEGERRVACSLLEQYGIDPHRIPQYGGVGPEGYREFLTDGEGRKVIEVDNNTTRLTEVIPWPEGFPVKSFLEHALNAGADLG